MVRGALTQYNQIRTFKERSLKVSALQALEYSALQMLEIFKERSLKVPTLQMLGNH